MSNKTPREESPRLRRAVFLDRDGTLNEEVGYIDDLARFRLYPFAGSAVRQLNQAGLLAIVLTNQSGVGRGIFPEELLKAVHDRLTKELLAAGATLDAIYYCPHHPKAEIPQYRRDCACRKPSTGMMREAAARFGIHMEESYVIGDRYRDVEMARSAGAHAVLVRTGFGQEEWEINQANGTCQPDHVADNVHDAVQWILTGLR
jgi:D-glycero-D-manno-heptose 1,7-bisphosphate phosphatase